MFQNIKILRCILEIGDREILKRSKISKVEIIYIYMECREWKCLDIREGS